MSRQRAWAAEAHKQVLSFANADIKTRKKFRTLCMKTPSIIHQSGLAQAIVFLRSRDGVIGEKFVDAIAAVLHTTRKDLANGEALQRKALTTGELEAYIMLTSEVSDVSGWFRRFAQIEIEADDSNDGVGHEQ